jgi:hypothetical protein
MSAVKIEPLLEGTSRSKGRPACDRFKASKVTNEYVSSTSLDVSPTLAVGDLKSMQWHTFSQSFSSPRDLPTAAVFNDSCGAEVGLIPLGFLQSSETIDSLEKLVKFVSDVHRHSGQKRDRKASDLIFSFFEGNLQVGNYEDCESALESFIRRLDGLSLNVLIAILAVTSTAKRQLRHYRPIFAAGVIDRVRELRGNSEADYVERLFK